MVGEQIEEKLNLEKVGRYLEDLGYKVVGLEQIWRHVTGTVKMENEKLFLKMAGTTEIGKRTENECRWNEKINSIWKNKHRSFRVPKIFDEGRYEDKYWFVSEMVFGKPLAEVNKPASIDEKDLLRAAEIAQDILEITDNCLLPKDKEHLKEIWKERVVKISAEWSKNIKTETKPLLQFIEERKNEVEIGTSQGDFTPWHIRKTKEKEYFVIDGEAAQIGGLKYYDVAYFYHRVYTKFKRPDLAKIFLDKFKKLNKWTMKNDGEFELVLASRIMGGYFDAERDGVTSFELNKELEEKIKQ